MEEFISKVIDIGSTYGGKVVLAIAVTVIGLLVIKLLGKAIKKALDKTNLADLAKIIIAKAAKILLYLVLVVGIVEILGVPIWQR